jgi:hypothetical protein
MSSTRGQYEELQDKVIIRKGTEDIMTTPKVHTGDCYWVAHDEDDAFTCYFCRRRLCPCWSASDEDFVCECCYEDYDWAASGRSN